MTRSHHHGCQHTMCQTPWLVERKVAKAPSLDDQLTYDEHHDIETDVYDQCDGCDYCDPSRANHVAYVIEHHRQAVDELIAAEDDWKRLKLKQFIHERIEQAMETMMEALGYPPLTSVP